MESDPRTVSVIIPTYNRAKLLGQTLDQLAAVAAAVEFEWSVTVVDNNSRDDTPSVVRSRQPSFPVRLTYLFEPQQGRSHALNAGVAATDSEVIAFIDDDVVVADGWLEAAVGPLRERTSGIDYTGGPVRPIWAAPRPRWLSAHRAELWGAIAILDYGSEAFVFEERRRVPLGANMAVRRSLLRRTGGFSPRLGRGSGRQLLGQEVPEFLLRVRDAGGRGLYVPTMIVDHHVPKQRLSKAYFRRWWFGKGLSRAELEHMHPVTELGLDLAHVRNLANIPLYMFRSAGMDLAGWVAGGLTFDPERQFRHEMMLYFFAGYVAARRRLHGAGGRTIVGLRPGV